MTNIQLEPIHLKWQVIADVFKQKLIISVSLKLFSSHQTNLSKETTNKEIPQAFLKQKLNNVKWVSN